MTVVNAQAHGRLVAELDSLDPTVLRAQSGKKWWYPAADALPAWIADMDFPVAPVIRERLCSVAERGVLGYPRASDARDLREQFVVRMEDRYGWSPDPGEVVEFTSVTQGVHVALHFATNDGDGVALHTPAFGPFLDGLGKLRRRLVPIPMVDTGAGWAFDAGRLARDVVDSDCRALLLVNPQNPTGRVFTPDELAVIAEIAERHDLVVISDEIHADLAFPPYEHVPFASLDPAVEARTITITSATKAFNLAGIRCAVAHVGWAPLRRVLAGQPGDLFGAPNTLGVHATLAAWTEADDWLDSVRGYLEGNRDLVAETLAAELPGVAAHVPEATYLAWLDCAALGWGADPAAMFRRHGNVELSPGKDFNPGGDGFVRLNFATSRPILREILRRMATSLSREF